jgi:hypothetical protein
MASYLRTELVLEALEMALWNRRPGPGLIHHRSVGSYASTIMRGRAPRVMNARHARVHERKSAAPSGAALTIHNRFVGAFAVAMSRVLHRRSKTGAVRNGHDTCAQKMREGPR